MYIALTARRLLARYLAIRLRTSCLSRLSIDNSRRTVDLFRRTCSLNITLVSVDAGLRLVRSSSITTLFNE
jgi:hypothetical protein